MLGLKRFVVFALFAIAVSSVIIAAQAPAGQAPAAGQRRQAAGNGDQQNRRSFVEELFGAGGALQLTERSAG